MSGFELIACVVCPAAGLAYINAKVLRLPSAIGLMAIALLGSLLIVALDAGGVLDSAGLQAFVVKIDFARVLMHGLLGFLLFAGALHVDLADLRANRWVIFLLAVVATVLSTLIVGGATWLVLKWLGHPVSLADTLLFGALISPTDPIAVLGILKSAKVPQQLSIQISGESLFNDGIGVVLFIVIGGASQGGELSASHLLGLFAREALGGALFGLAIGYVGYRVLKSIDVYSVEVLITLAIVLGGYAVAERLHISAPIAAVVSGLVVGNQGRQLGMSDQTRHHVDLFWELVDEILNAVLFLLLGLQATRLALDRSLIAAMASAILITLAARFVSVAVTVPLLPRALVAPHYVKTLTWAGLRGGISVALALSLAPGPAQQTLLALTYAVVAFSILGQGLSLGWFLRRTSADASALAPTS
ncbi:MAG TPA: sodium:proton antiporter [Polyangiaceae bacterium]|nr:sodium:proton antiporter [Polyangiaceae bacterium]